MKKYISVAIITIMVLSALALTACGGGSSNAEDLANSKYVGTWKLTSDGFKTSGDMKLTFTDDGDNIKTKMLGAELVFEKQ